MMCEFQANKIRSDSSDLPFNFKIIKIAHICYDFELGKKLFFKTMTNYEKKCYSQSKIPFSHQLIFCRIENVI